MQITQQDSEVGRRQPTIARNYSLGQEFFRSAEWTDGDAVTKVTAVAFVSGIRALRKPDGSIDLLGQISRFDVLRKDEFIQPVERAVFLWERGDETDVDYSNEVGLYYSATVEEAERQCQMFLENLDFEANFDPAAWV